MFFRISVLARIVVTKLVIVVMHQLTVLGDYHYHFILFVSYFHRYFFFSYEEEVAVVFCNCQM